ncbi:MAG: glutamate synthase subunit beta [Spirochaetales bacterium]|nr:MAG: glutamate synthase subunit beta [Spirochaetales bacterium]
MGKPTGFLDYKRFNPGSRPVEERLKDYNEVYEEVNLEELKKQASRCMDCGVPFCHSLGCPLSNLVPEWNDAVYRGQWQEAYMKLQVTNNFPEITGRVCPALCEASCTLSVNDSPVTIRQIELSLMEKAFDEGWVKPLVPASDTGRGVAVIGSGPAGLAAAQELRRKGHRVTVFEAASKPGGILRYGIPNFKLEKWVLDRRLEQLKAEGIEFETGVNAGEDVSAGYIQRKFDALLLSTGAGKPRDLPVQGRGFEGIHYAMDYLTGASKFSTGDIGEEHIIHARDKVVLVVGGGDTGSDCIGTALRQGAKKVYQFEILPKAAEWEDPWNPDWPDWPRILRSSSSHEEGCERDWGIETLRFSGRGIQVEEATFCRVNWDMSAVSAGKPPKMERIPGSEFSLKVDLVLLAMGFLHAEHSRLVTDLGLELDSRGNLAVDAAGMTSHGGVFAAGDAVTGASLVVKAIAQGRSVAADADAWLLSK